MTEDGAKAIFGLAAMVIVGGFNTYKAYGTDEPVSFMVDKTERVMTGSGKESSSKYKVWTTHDDGTTEVFENTDTAFHWKWRSDDLQGKFKDGVHCEGTANGWRNGFLSWNRNILDAECTQVGSAEPSATSVKPMAPVGAVQ